MLVQCQKCGAPLDVKGTERMIRCAYCGTTTKLAGTHTIASETPDGWKPPKQWVPKPESHLPSKPLAYRPRAAFMMVWQFFTIGVVTTAVLVPMVMSGVIQIPFFGKVARWDGQSTLACELNETLEIEDREATVTSGPVIEATGPNCHVVIRRSRLSGAVIVRGAINTEITVEDSVLRATDTAITGPTNLKVWVRGRSTVHGVAHAIDGDMNPEVEVLGPAEVTSDGDAIVGESNMHVAVREGVVRGRSAIVGGVNARVRAFRGRLEGTGGPAVRLSRNADYEADGTEIVEPPRGGAADRK